MSRPAPRRAHASFTEKVARVLPATSPQWTEARAFAAALLSGDAQTASAIVNTLLDDGELIVEISQHVIRPSLCRVGERWEAGMIPVAQEARATAIAQAVMRDAAARLPRGRSSGSRVLLGCVAGNHHAVGLQMVSDAFQAAGWDVHSLGANAPTESFLTTGAEWNPTIIGLSASLETQLPTVKDLIAQVRQRFPTAPPSVIIGGLAFSRLQRPAEMVGADGYAPDALGAVACAKVIEHAKLSCANVRAI